MSKISIIIPVYNVEDYLERCLKSITSQTYKNLEIILINDGSTDRSGELCDIYKKKDSRIEVIHKENSGQSAARNMGLDIASGDYIAFVDSDDWIEEGIYEHCINLFGSYDCDVIDFECQFKNSYSEKTILNNNEQIEVNEGKEILRAYLKKGQTRKAPFTVWRKIYKSNLFNSIRFPEGKINEDIVTNYKLLFKCNKIIYTKKIGYFYFQDNVSTTRDELKKRDFDLLDASEELVRLTENENYKDIKYLANVKLARSYFTLLTKIAYYGVADEIKDEKKITKDLTKSLRSNLKLLVKSPMPLNRKVMAVMMCVNLRLVSLPLSIYQKISR